MHKPSVILTGKNAGDWYIQTLNRLINDHPTFEYDTIQVNFEPINALLPFHMEAAAQMLQPYFTEMETRQKPYILANITLHEAVKYFSFAPKYFISIENILRDALKSIQGKVVILGTKYTMNHTYISSLFPKVEIVSLPEKIQDKIEKLRQVYFESSDRKMTNEVIGELNQLEPGHYIIACTELALALDDYSLELKTIHLPELQCKYLIQKWSIESAKK
jgi:aspartate/glutamate racemase